ncbi:MAG: AAA family ATPase [Firmicutes bacterium]|nr:AAA family ATPase [Bacillota bacterium]
MDKRDEIILQQLEVIRTMSENNLSRMKSDFWGFPKPSQPAENKTAEKEKKNTPPTNPPKPADKKAIDQKTEEPAEEETPENIEDLKAELATYIGLENIKQEVSNLINMATVYKLREAHGLPNVDMSLHMVFSGNPGTGKTMIARLMGRIYKSLGILSKGQLVEVDRSQLVAGYVGQTAIKTAEVIEKAKGGVLFIDEAYALTDKGGNDFGDEAIETILKAMEDNRDDLVVIVAGYIELMEDFINSNPGLESRFNRYLHFDDYTLDEMLQIFEMQCKKGCYTLDDEAKAAVKEYIRTESEADDNFGNARGVRNCFENVLVEQNNRLAAMESITKEDLMSITAADIRKAQGIEETEAEDTAEESAKDASCAEADEPTEKEA